ncbi:MAG: hypothetical protein A2136_03075 [Chloroflexi bacterium RBG_16_54_11]|nr:MAG: hypothetical protein A2136_03075 [Chloroflexi bacterium RBG_16_54_11]
MVYFSDDVSPRSDTTNQGGHYRFTTLAPGTNFLLTFSRADNPQLTPTAEIAFNAWIEGNLLTGVDIITLPDFEISLTLENIFFELQAPTDGAVFSAAAINSSNPLMFIWNPYNQGDSYYIELGANNSGGLSWASNMTTSNYIMWDGNLSDGSHVTEGSYWWRVIVRNAVGNYTLYIQSDDWDLLFNP